MGVEGRVDLARGKVERPFVDDVGDLRRDLAQQLHQLVAGEFTRCPRSRGHRAAGVVEARGTPVERLVEGILFLALDRGAGAAVQPDRRAGLARGVRAAGGSAVVARAAGGVAAIGSVAAAPFLHVDGRPGCLGGVVRRPVLGGAGGLAGNHRVAALLQDVGDLMGHQAQVFGPFAGTQPDVLTVGEGPCAEFPGQAVGRRPGVHLHLAEIGAKRVFKARTQAPRQAADDIAAGRRVVPWVAGASADRAGVRFGFEQFFGTVGAQALEAWHGAGPPGRCDRLAAQHCAGDRVGFPLEGIVRRANLQLARPAAQKARQAGVRGDFGGAAVASGMGPGRLDLGAAGGRRVADGVHPDGSRVSPWGGCLPSFRHSATTPATMSA